MIERVEATPSFPSVVQVVLDTTDVRGLAEFYRKLLGFAYRAGKFILRNKIAVAAATAFLILAIIATVLVINQSIRAARERDKAQQVSQFLIELFNVSDPGEAHGNTITAREI